MVLAYRPAIFEEILDFILSSPSPEEIIPFKSSKILETRLLELLTKSKQESLTRNGQNELESFLQLNHFMHLLKLRACKKT